MSAKKTHFPKSSSGWTECPDPHTLRAGLEGCCQLWMISSIEGVLQDDHMAGERINVSRQKVQVSKDVSEELSKHLQSIIGMCH
jgi:hypothetical protein